MTRRSLAARWGARATWAFTALLVVYNATYVVLAVTGPRAWHGVDDYLQTWSLLEFVPQMIGLVALPLLGFALVAVHQLVEPARRAFSLAAVIAGSAFLTVVWVGYLVQVAWLLPALRAGSTTGVELVGWRDMDSPALAVNVAGWTLSDLMGWALAAAVTGGAAGHQDPLAVHRLRRRTAPAYPVACPRRRRPRHPHRAQLALRSAPRHRTPRRLDPSSVERDPTLH